MWLNLLFVIFVVAICLNYMFLDIKVEKIKRDSLNKDQIIDSLIAHNKALCKLNTGFKDHERRIIDIENHLSSGEKHFELSKEPKYTCNDCKYYHALSGVGFTNGISHFKCEKIGCTYPIECNETCQVFEKAESIDEDENVIYYANNAKVDISSKKEPRIYKTERIFVDENGDYADRITKLYLDGGINFADASALLERLKQ